MSGSPRIGDKLAEKIRAAAQMAAEVLHEEPAVPPVPAGPKTGELALTDGRGAPYYVSQRSR